MKKIVFAGPSIFGLDRDSFSDLEFRPPAAAGDLIAAVQEEAMAIGLIDGVFDGPPSVWHKEILAALSLGIPVFGAASMGALRAAECYPYGMIGIGGIFEEFRDGYRTADSDVAVQHAPEKFGFLPLTIALVDVEATVTEQISRKRISQETGEKIVNSARSLNFRDRNWFKIAELAFAAEIAQEKGDWFQAFEVSQKRIDAENLLKRMLNCAPGTRSCWQKPNETFSRTDYFALLEQRARRSVSQINRNLV